MKSVITILGLVGLAGLTWAAQPPVQPQPPRVSPYINLLRPGSSALNYYGLVRPQVYNQNALQGVQQQFESFTESSTNEPAGVRATGHSATFNYTGRYFPYPGGVAGRNANNPGQPGPPGRR